MSGDKLFDFIEHAQGKEPWGSVLDAGTGHTSLNWLTGLKTMRWTAVTGSQERLDEMTQHYGSKLRAHDRFVLGNWSDALFLENDHYDVVLADYLLGAMEDFSPYYQDQLFMRLRPHVTKHLYFIGQEPYPNWTDDPWGKAILDLSHLCDAAILIAGYRPYREYPMNWVIRHMEAAGFSIVAKESFPIIYSTSFIDKTVEDCLTQLHYFTDRALALDLEKAALRLKDHAYLLYDKYRGTPFSADYVIHAVPKQHRDRFL